MLTSEQIERYERDGYLLLRGQIDEASLQRFERGLEHNPPLDGSTGNVVWPAPGRYTLAKSSLADPDLGFMVEHERIVPIAAALLEDDPVLTAFMVYDRTPGGGGLGAHHDYKRWRPVGSSLKWCFAIVPVTDFDELAGPLYIAPGSHRRSMRVSMVTTSERASPSPSVCVRNTDTSECPRAKLIARLASEHQRTFHPKSSTACMPITSDLCRSVLRSGPPTRTSSIRDCDVATC